MNITKQLNKDTTMQIVNNKIIISTKIIISKNKEAYLLVTSEFDYKHVIKQFEGNKSAKYNYKTRR